MTLTSLSASLLLRSSFSIAQGTVIKRIRRSRRKDQLSMYQRSSSILFLTLVCSVFGFTLQPVAQRSLPADRAGMFSALNPVGAVFWGFLFLGEALTPAKLAGAALILAGLLLPLFPVRSRRTH